MRLVLDWDGTVTEEDTLHLVLERFGDVSVFGACEEALLAGTMTLHDVIAAEFATVRAPLDEVVAWLLDAVRIRPGFRELVEERAPLVVSSGFRQLIEPVLAREGVRVELLANEAVWAPAGWRTAWRDLAVCAVCGQACKRNSLPPAPVAYAGDGYSDRCAALAADRVFATGSLAGWLEEQGVPYEPFADLHDVRRVLGTWA